MPWRRGGRQDLQGQALVTESTVEALGDAVHPRATGLDVERRDADATEPGTKLVGSKLRSVVTANVLRNAPHREQLDKRVYNIVARDPAIGLEREGFPSELVYHREPLELAATRRAIEDEVPAPNVVRRLRPSPMASIGACAQTTPSPILLSHFQPLSLPESKNTRHSGPPSFEGEQPTDRPIAGPRSSTSQLKHPRYERCLVGSRLSFEWLTAVRLIDRLTGPSLGDVDLRTKLDDRRSLPGRVRWTRFFGQIWALDTVELGWWPARPIPRVSRGHESVHGMGAV